MSGNDITLSSTTDTPEQIEQALDHDQETGYSESPFSSGRVTIASTTDSQEQVDEAAALHDTAVEEGVEGYISPVIRVDGVASTTDDEKSVRQAAEDLRQEIEERPDYLTGRSSVKKRIAQLVKERGTLEEENARLRGQLAGENTKLREQLESREPAPAAEAEAGDEPPREDESRSQQQPPAQPQRQYTQQDYQNHVQQRYKALEPTFEAVRKNVGEDFDQSLAQMREKFPLSDLAHLAVLELPDAPQVGYWLSKNPQAVLQLWQMENSGNGVGVIQAVHNLAAGLRFQAYQQQQQQPQQQRPQAREREEPRPAAPRPLRHVGGSGAGTSSLDPDQMSQRDYNKWRDAGGGR